MDFRSRIEKQSSGQGHPLLVYVEKLLSAFERAVEKQSTTHPKKPELIEPLSERELEVLRLVAQGLTNNEISQRLVLALSTVKGHNLRIFGKLQAQNRSEAVSARPRAGPVVTPPKNNTPEQYFWFYPAIPGCRYITCTLSKWHRRLWLVTTGTGHVKDTQLQN